MFFGNVVKIVGTRFRKFEKFPKSVLCLNKTQF